MGRSGWFAIGIVVGLAVGAGVGFLLGGSSPGDAADADLQGPVEAAGTPPPLLRGTRRAPSPSPLEAEAQEGEAPATNALPGKDPVGILLYGALLAPDGSPVDARWVTFTNPEKPDARRIARAENAAGYSITGLTPGTWMVDLNSQGFRRYRKEIEVGRARVQRMDFHLEVSTTVRIRLETPDGVELREAIQELSFGPGTAVVVVATRERPAGSLPMTDLRSHSRFGIGEWRSARGFMAQREKRSFPAGVAGEIEVAASPPFFVSAVLAHVVLATERVDSGEEEVTLVVSPESVKGALATVRLRLVDATTGEPITDARVSLTDTQTGGGGPQVGPDGIVILENRKPGLLDLEIWSGRYAGYRKKLRVEPGLNDLGTLRLDLGTTARGLVVDASGTPVQATIQWENLDHREFPQRSHRNRSARCDTDGTFTLERLAEGRYIVWAVVEKERIGYGSFHTAQLTADPVRITVRPSHAVTIDARAMSPRKRYVLTIWDGDLPAFAYRYRQPYAYAAHLPAGTYTYEIHDDLVLVREGKIEVDGKEPATIQVP